MILAIKTLFISIIKLQLLHYCIAQNNIFVNMKGSLQIHSEAGDTIAINQP
jgi:hypothetical protein